MPSTPSSRPATATVGAFAAASPGPADVLSAVSTFLFTDIEGSTRLWEEHADGMGPALAQHDRLLRASIDAHGGSVIKTTGDGMLAVFADAGRGHRRGARRPARAARCDVGRDRPAAGPDGAPRRRRRGARRRLLRARPQPRGADPGHRPRRPDHLLGGRRRARRRRGSRRRSSSSTSARIGCATSTDPSRSTRSSSATSTGTSRRSAR